MDKKLPYIDSIEQFDQIVRDKPADRELIVFKVSPACNLSFMAEGQMNEWLEELSDDPGFDIYKVDVIGDRSVSQHIEGHFEIRHESPQILWVGVDTRVRWHGSHRAVSRDNLRTVAAGGDAPSR